MAAMPCKVDSRGRVCIGKDFANSLVLITRSEDGAVTIVPAEAIPAREAWLYKNKEALASVMRGLKATAAEDFAEAPDLGADAKIADAVKG